MADSRWKWILGGGAVLVGIAYAFRNSAGAILDKAVSIGQEAAFAAALPSGVDDYAEELIEAGEKYGVSPWALAGIMYRESSGGNALKPKGPTGTGDFTPRWSGNLYFKYANPATGLPPDGLGWGRGLMQIDFGAQNAWVTTNAWWDPQVNIDKAASILASNMAYFSRAPGGPITVDSWRLSGFGINSQGPYPDPRPLSGPALQAAALAAYNAGPSGVLQALAAGLPPSKPTTGRDYADWIASRVASWQSSFV